MPKYLLISGSPRKGNTDYILNKIFKSLGSNEKEIVYLRDKNISHCRGCLVCDKTNKCVMRDDMDEIMEKLKEAEIIVLGTPNYFDNVPGIVKDFIDRTNPFYKTDFLKGKKVYAIVIGGGKLENSERVIDGAIKYFVDAKHMKLIGSACFQALVLGEVENNPKTAEIIENISKKLNDL
jgi:multimeric flavodoxin WrbA